MNICIDFDGTCVTHEYPLVGRDIGAVPVLKDLVKHGHNLILFTMREKIGFDRLKDAVDWFEDNGIPLYGIQTNPTQKSWTDSPKAYGELYIDDAALGVPLIFPSTATNNRPYVDWVKVRVLLEQRGLIPYKESDVK